MYLLDLDNWFTVWGRLYQEIERKLREAGIEVPFPQRDVHLRSADPTVSDTGATAEAILPKAAVKPPEEEASG